MRYKLRLSSSSIKEFIYILNIFYAKFLLDYTTYNWWKNWLFVTTKKGQKCNCTTSMPRYTYGNLRNRSLEKNVKVSVRIHYKKLIIQG